MRKPSSQIQILTLFVLTLTLHVVAQTPSSACGNQPYCVETNDFVATITSFKTSMTTSNVKVIDTTIRFQNKTNQQLILGYVISSGMATDDQGNRLVVGGPNGYRGIGYVNGNNFEAKFVVRPGGSSDAQFELLAQGWPKIVGFTHNMDLTVSEINSYEGNQHTIGSEFPLHFQGLKNGSAGNAPALGSLVQGVASSSPCGLAGTQGAAGKASSAVSGAANTISNLGSIFGRKKTQQNANQVANAAAGCDPRVNDVASKAGMVAGAAVAANAQSNTAQAAQAQMVQAAANQTAMTQGAVSQSAMPQTSTDLSTATGVTSTTPADLAASSYSAVRKSQAKRQQKGATTTIASNVAPINPAGTSASAPALGAAPQELQGAQLQEPGAASPTVGAANKSITATKYDILGIHLGMPVKDAAALLKARNMQLSPDTLKYAFLSGPLTYGLNAANQVLVRSGGAKPESEKVYLLMTMPPNQQVVSKISRYLMFSKDTAPTNDSLVADLTKKYGQPSYDSHPPNLYARGYRELYWVDDANGHRLLNQSMGNGGYSEQINNCRSIATFSPNGSGYNNDFGIEVDPVWVKGRLEEGFGYRLPAMYHCADLTIVYAKLLYGYPIGVSSPDVVGGLIVVIGSGPLDRLSTDATHEYLLRAAKEHDQQQKSAAQKNKPAL